MSLSIMRYAPPPEADTDSDADTDASPVYDGGVGTPSDSFGGRSYTLYVPPTYDPSTPAPLVIGFHGSGDSGSNFWQIVNFVGYPSAADSQGALLLVPDTASPFSDWVNGSGYPNNGFSNGGLFLGVAGFANADRFATLSVISYGWRGFYIVPPSRTLPVQVSNTATPSDLLQWMLARPR